MKKSNRSNFLLRFSGIVIMLIVFALAAFFAVVLNNAYDQVIHETKNGFDINIKVAVETVIGALKANQQQYIDGLISEDAAMETAKKIVRDARYSSAPDKKDDGYFWADMADGLCVVHYNANNEGAMRWNAQDQEGTHFIQKFIQNGNAGGDYSDFYFGKPGDENGSHKKRGYTEKFEPYGWYISTGNYYEDIDVVIQKFTSQKVVWFIFIGAFTVLAIVLVELLIRWMTKRIHWYDNILDSIPFPLSITDNNRSWTFINKAVENFLGKTRGDVMGQQCSNWGAGICNTDNCGIVCLERGQATTTFSQAGMDFKVDSAYLTDKNNRRTGHIEIVSDITELIKKQKAEAELVAGIGTISQTFVNESKQIASGAQALAQGAVEQASFIDDLSGSISKIADNTKTNAEIAGKTADLANTIKSNAEKGSRQMGEMIRAVGEINEASQQINKVIKTIDDIAFQTNILALNAAVEAARAGQHGKGFAVVAEEVRNLATKSADAAKDTAGLIENSISKAELGSQIANETATSLTEIVSGINESSQYIVEIAQLSEEQLSGISKITSGVNQVSQVVQQNSATAEQSAAASGEMSNQANELEKLISRFRQRDEDQRALPGRSSRDEDYGKY